MVQEKTFREKLDEVKALQAQLHEQTATNTTVLYNRQHDRGSVANWFRMHTIDVSHQHHHWRAQQSPLRRPLLWRPSLFIHGQIRLLAFDLALCFTAASCVSALACYGTILSLPMSVFTLTTLPLGLLVTFKTQQSYARFIEGRNLWGGMINESRAISSRILAKMPSETSIDAAQLAVAKNHAMKLVRTFPFTLKYHLTEDGCNPHITVKADKTVLGKSVDPDEKANNAAELKEATTLALTAELDNIWDLNNEAEKAVVDRILSMGANRPLTVLHELSMINSRAFSAPSVGNLTSIETNEVDLSLTRFQDILGACEKILRTPVYTPYTRFISRCLTAWCFMLPMAIHSSLGTFLTPPMTVVIAFFLLGIENIGMIVEQPFNCFPLWQYCQVIDASCVQLQDHAETLKKVNEEAVRQDTFKDLSSMRPWESVKPNEFGV